MGRPIGSQNKDKPFRDALRQVLLEAGESRVKLKHIALALLEKGGEGDVAAIKEIGDRLDGRVPQAIENGEGGAFVLTWLAPSKADGEDGK